MTALRVTAVLLTLAAMVPLGLHLAARASHTLADLPQAASPPPTIDGDVRPRGREPRTDTARRGARHPARMPTGRPAAGERPGGLLAPDSGRLLVLVAFELAGCGALVLAGTGALALRRVRRRRTRRYGVYQLQLSTHDEAKPQDLEDMVEAIAHLVRAYPVQRARDGQPHISFELVCAPSTTSAADAPELEWSLNVRCEPALLAGLDAAIHAAYPDVRLSDHSAQPSTRALGVPPRLLRLRKQRSFVYPLLASDDALASPPLEQIALAQVALAAPSIVRFQLTPAPTWFEALGRRLYRRHENKLVRAEHWGLREGGLTSTLNRAEMRNAEQTQNRSLFWLELTIAAPSPRACKTLAAAVQARRGENHLHRRYMLVRRNLYRRRFPHALPPLIPSPRALVSAAEVAHLLELPSARMKGVPVRRATVPRIPAPPEALRADDLDPIAAPGADVVQLADATPEQAATAA